MKFLWFKSKSYDIWRITEDYSYWTIYYKRDNYIIPYSWKTTKNDFNNYKRDYKLKEISEGDAILEML